MGNRISCLRKGELMIIMMLFLLFLTISLPRCHYWFSLLCATQFLWCECREFGIGSTNNPICDDFCLFSLLFCLILFKVVRRNSTLVTQVWIFSLPVCWIIYECYKEKLHVNHCGFVWLPALIDSLALREDLLFPESAKFVFAPKLIHIFFAPDESRRWSWHCHCWWKRHSCHSKWQLHCYNKCCQREHSRRKVKVSKIIICGYQCS